MKLDTEKLEKVYAMDTIVRNITSRLVFEHDISYDVETGLIDILPVRVWTGHYNEKVYEAWLKQVNTFGIDNVNFRLRAWSCRENLDEWEETVEELYLEEGETVLDSVIMTLEVKSALSKDDCIDISNYCNGLQDALDLIAIRG